MRIGLSITNASVKDLSKSKFDLCVTRRVWLPTLLVLVLYQRFRDHGIQGGLAQGRKG